MKVLYIATSFPEPNKGATIYTDLAEELHKSGHEVVVAVTNQESTRKKTQIKYERGFEVLRINVGNYFDVGFIQKGITTLRIPALMKRGISRFLKNRTFDFILFEAPPVTNGKLVNWAKRMFKCPAYLMLKDIFPQNAIDLGIIKKGSLLEKYFNIKEHQLFKTADYIGCMSVANKNFIIDNNVWLNKDKIELFPNTKKIKSIQTMKPNIRKDLNIPEEACVFLFGGNMGKPQYIDLHCHAVLQCKNQKNIFFLFVGRGTDRYKLEETIKEHNISNALVIENLPRDQYEDIMQSSDVGLITLDPRFTIPNYPSRILSYMEYAKPILAATDKVTDLKNLLEEVDCGGWVWSGDKEGFVRKIKEMANNSHIYKQGLNGREYIENHFNVRKSVEILENHFN
ncbi:glycosyltransferase family 4 protein [Fictibacillus aquaticus]|uniref:Glycosyl transferase family 1 domain-containing protein n=1 Tax=Fictibacillus aquaticus TaxID=2021314 RepID=A0A235F941_9BACL|nr:glycosyltransferase family 4 protein [Fictibacillus aquaticus]OYD57604.1 hypothetical protein CGZ90_13130 [Fictibacillus aquaticus]